MKKISLFFFLAIGWGLALAQTAPINPTNFIRTDLIPASPNASSIGKYGEVPMNLSTGSANYSIPIFTVTGNELSLPITLNYSYDGYKPSQPVGWVGLGWSLNAGGVISRTIKDKVDGTSPANYRFDSDSVSAKINTVNHNQNFKDFLHDIVTGGSYDSEPDIYSFNFGRYSGKFIKFKNKYYCFPYQKFKISGTASSFTIITDDGTKYIFNAVETTSPKTTSVNSYAIPTYNSSFYLTSITNAGNTESITLNYSGEGTIVQPGSFSQTYKDYLGSNRNHDAIPDHLFDPAHANSTYVTPLRLTSITSDKFNVNFAAGAIRTDINQNLVGPGTYTGSARALSGISVTDNFGNRVKSYKLKQGYLANNLRLDSLLEYEITNIGDDVVTIDTTKFQRTAFEYNAVDALVKTDARVDHYGFYMGGGQFTNIVIPNFIVTGGPDRNPVLGGTLNGAMTKIKFPTGGYSTIDYELNKKNIGSEYLKRSLMVSSTISRTNNSATNVINSSSVGFVINYAQTVTVHLERTPKSLTFDGKVKGTEDMFIYNNTISQLVASPKIFLDSENGGINISVTLPVGNYYFYLICDGFENGVNGYILYKELTDIPIEGEEAGGLRVNRITSYPVTGIPITKTYRYTYENGFSSGTAHLGAYDQKNYTERVNGNGLDWWEDYYQISNSFIGENYYLGVPHSYSSVTESTFAGNRNLVTRTDFKVYDGDFLGIDPIRVTQYRSDANNQLVRLQKTEYAYKVLIDTLIRALKPYQTMGGSGGPPPNWDYEAVEYEYQSAFKYLVSTRTTSYDGPDSVSTITYNGYDLAKTKNLLNTRRVDSKGRQMVTYFKYPESYSSSLNNVFITANVLTPVWEQQVWSKNAAGTDSVLISSNVQQYSATNFKPLKVYTLSAANVTSLNNETKDGNGLYTSLLDDSRLEERITFIYDSYGKIIRQQLSQGAPISYQWGYRVVSDNKVNVIAECKNALETEFFHENFEELSTNVAYGNAHTGYKYGISYTVSWAKPNTRAYLITYFYLSGGVWKYKQDTFSNGYACSGGSGYDDVSIFPADGQISTYTYDPGIGVRSTIDARGNTTYFEYDQMNRLKNIRDQAGNIIKNFRYHTAGNQYAGGFSQPYGNQAMSATFTRSNCGLGYTGSTVTITVNANTYGGITQEEANAKAQAYLASDGQAQANIQGTCTWGVEPQLTTPPPPSNE